MPESKATYDLEKVYDEQIAPLMTQIIDICHRYDLPFLATFQYGADEEEGDKDFCTTLIRPESRGDTSELARAAKCLQLSSAMLAITITHGPKEP